MKQSIVADKQPIYNKSEFQFLMAQQITTIFGSLVDLLENPTTQVLIRIKLYEMIAIFV